MSLSGRQQYPPPSSFSSRMNFAVCLRGDLVKTGISSLIKSSGVHDSKESNTLVHSKQLQVREQMSQHLWGTQTIVAS